MLYFETENLPILFELVRKYYGRNEEVPAYESYRDNVAKLSGVLAGVKSDTFYPSIAQKTAYLFLQINKGHFFPNGNKRLALVAAISFININDHRIKELTLEEYQFLIQKLFPKYEHFQNFPDFFPEEFALYNISIAVAESHKYVSNFEELKKSVEAFFEFALVEVPNIKRKEGSIIKARRIKKAPSANAE